MTIEEKISEFLYRAQDWIGNHFDKVVFDIERGANTAEPEEILATDLILFMEAIKSKFRVLTDEEAEFYMDRYYDLTGIRDVPVGSDSQTFEYTIAPAGSGLPGSQDIVTSLRVGNAAIQLVNGVWHISDQTGQDYLLLGKGQLIKSGPPSTEYTYSSHEITQLISDAIASIDPGLSLDQAIVDALVAAASPGTTNPFLTKNDITGVINFRHYNPEEGGIADNTAQFDQAQLDAFSQGRKVVFVPKGTYRVKSKSYPNQSGSIRMYIFYVPFIFEPGSKLIYEGSGGDERGLNIQPILGPLRAERLSITPTATATRLQIQAQKAGLPYVKAMPGSETQVGDFNVGDYIHICCGVNFLDFDDPLWFRDIIARIISIDTITGTIYLDRNIPFPLSDDGFDGTTPPDYAQGTPVTSGDWFMYNQMIYEAIGDGTTSAADPADDGYISSITINNGGLDYESGKVTIRALQPINGDYVDLKETFAVTLDGNGTITNVTPQSGVSGYTNEAVIVVVSDDNTATVLADLSVNVEGVPFRKVTNAHNGLVETDRNASPMIQKIIFPVVDVTIQGNGSEIVFEDEVQSMLVVRNALDCGFDNWKVYGKTEFIMNTGNGATNATFKRINGLEVEEQTTANASKSRIFSGFGSTGVKLIDCKGVCGADGTDAQAIRLESFTDLEIIGGEYHNRYPGAVNSYGVYFDPGYLVRMEGAKLIDFRFPFRTNTAAENGFLDRQRDPSRTPLAKIGHVAGNTFICSAQGLRTAGVHPTKVFNANNTYIFTETHNGNSIVHPETIEFVPLKQEILWLEYPVGSFPEDAWQTLGPQLMMGQDAINLNNYRFVLLGMKALVLDQPENSMLTIRLSSENGTIPPRFFFSNNSSENDIELFAQKSMVEFTNGAGGTDRFFDTLLENVQHRYQVKGQPGGYVRLMFNVLIAER